MFYYVKGKVAICEPGLVVIDAGGVGYAVQTSATSASQVQPGDNATFYTYLHVREDIFDLYGFITRDELDCFKLLLGISGVGPKAALSILSVTNPASLALAVLTDDQKALSAAPGVGKKLAQRIILELKDRMSKGQLESAASVEQNPELAKGIVMTLNAFRAVMEQYHVSAFGETGDPFDPEMHNAVAHIENEELGENVISMVFRKGYRVGDRVIRPAMVQVAN